MKTKLTLLSLALIAGLANKAQAQTPTGSNNLDINNVDALFLSGSDMFWDLSGPKFEVPKGGGKHTIFAGALWIGGLDQLGNLHLAGQTYRQTGLDFVPGPIDSSLGQSAPWAAWDKCWKVSAAEVLDHQLNYTTPNYIVPPSIAEWPGYDAQLGRVLAPFADVNANGIYDPQFGDYPYILGDQSVYTIYNDLTTHTETTCTLPLGVEIHREAFAFDDPSNPAINNSIFMRYYVKNFSLNTYSNLRLGLWTDFDLGNAVDDYVGTDVGLNMFYVYNGDIDDETPAGYGLNPPAQGIYFLNQTLTNSIAFDNINNLPTGNPSTCSDYFNLLQSIWLDNQPLTYGEAGRNFANQVCNYIFPGTTDPVNYPISGAWDETIAGNPPGDRRILGSIGPFTLAPGEVLTFDVGNTFSQATSGGPLASVAQLQADVAALRVLYNNGQLLSVPSVVATPKQTLAYPNPASDVVTLENKGGTYDVAIFDIAGKQVYNKQNVSSEKLVIKTTSFESGIYIISVTRDSITEKLKLVVQ